MRNEVLSYDDLVRIVELIKSAEAFSEFHLKVGDIELDLRKHGKDTPPLHAVPDSASPGPGVQREPPPASSPAEPAPAAAPAVVPAAAGAAGRADPVRSAPAEIAEGAVVIESPMVGTFYRSPEPGAKPFVEVGQQVTPDSTVCIIEVMKLMNSIHAGCEGKVVQVLVQDAQPVEMGQALVVIDPKG